MAGKCGSDGNTDARIIWRTLRKQGLQDRVMQSRFVLVDKNEGKSTAESPLDTKHPLALSFLDTQIQMCSTFAETHQPFVLKP